MDSQLGLVWMDGYGWKGKPSSKSINLCFFFGLDVNIELTMDSVLAAGRHFWDLGF